MKCSVGGVVRMLFNVWYKANVNLINHIIFFVHEINPCIFIKKTEVKERGGEKPISKQSTLQRVISRSTLSKENNDTIARPFTLPHIMFSIFRVYKWKTARLTRFVVEPRDTYSFECFSVLYELLHAAELITLTLTFELTYKNEFYVSEHITFKGNFPLEKKHSPNGIGLFSGFNERSHVETAH